MAQQTQGRRKKKTPTRKGSKKQQTKQTMHACIILDQSGSMSSCREATIEAFNQTLQDLRKHAKETPVKVSLIVFENHVDVRFFEESIEKAKDLTYETYVPGAMTAMLDAVGTGINRLSSVRGAKKSQNHAFLMYIISDGWENASQEHTYETIAKMIKERLDDGRWKFIYQGANQDLSELSRMTNIPQGDMLRYASTDQGTRTAIRASTGAFHTYMSNVAHVGAICSNTAGFFNDDGSVLDVSSELKIDSSTTEDEEVKK